MTTREISPRPPGTVGPTYDEWRDRRWRLTGAGIGLMAIVSVTLMLTLGVRPASYGDLLSAVAASEVTEVDALSADEPSTGDLVELRWTTWGVLDHRAEVRVGESRGYDAWAEPEYVSSSDPRETLRSINPNLTIKDRSGDVGWSTTFMEWEAPGLVVLLALASWLAAFLLLVGGPEPWRATRWAWFWVWLATGPLGAMAYLLLGGPSGIGRPRNPRRRLTGGWAFLIGVVFFGGANGA